MLPSSPPASLSDPLTLSDQLHLIPSSLVYRLLPPGTVKTLHEYLVKNLIQTQALQTSLVKFSRTCIYVAHKDLLLSLIFSKFNSVFCQQ